MGKENSILANKLKIKCHFVFPFEFRNHYIKMKKKKPGSSLLSVNNRTIQRAIISQGNFFLKGEALNVQICRILAVVVRVGCTLASINSSAIKMNCNLLQAYLNYVIQDGKDILAGTLTTNVGIWGSFLCSLGAWCSSSCYSHLIFFTHL